MLCDGCKNPVFDGTCACPGVVEDLKNEAAKLRAEVERLNKNEYTEYICSVCLTGIRERESRCEEGGLWYHPLCKVTKERDAALLQVCELSKTFEAYGEHKTGCLTLYDFKLPCGCGFAEAVKKANQDKWASEKPIGAVYGEACRTCGLLARITCRCVEKRKCEQHTWRESR